jgi:hypothetical protein
MLSTSGNITFPKSSICGPFLKKDVSFTVRRSRSISSSVFFVSIMNFVNRHQKRMSVRQKASRLSLTIINVTSVKSAIDILSEILNDFHNEENVVH